MLIRCLCLFCELPVHFTGLLKKASSFIFSKFLCNIFAFKNTIEDFPGSSVIKNILSNAGDAV